MREGVFFFGDKESGGETGADFGRNAGGFRGVGVNRDPQSAGLGQKVRGRRSKVRHGESVRWRIRGQAANFNETFEGSPGGFADPRAQEEFVAKGGGRFVIDLMA